MASQEVTFERVFLALKGNDKFYLESLYESLGRKMSTVSLVSPAEQFNLATWVKHVD